MVSGSTRMRGIGMVLINNRIVNCDALLADLEKRFSGNLKADFYSKEDIEITIDEYIQDNVEKLAYEQAGLIFLESNILIDDVIDNINEFRDTQHYFVNKLSDAMFATNE